MRSVPDVYENENLAMKDLLPLLTYVFVMYVTPGPNNVMLTASGVNFGFRRTLPHISGICLGSSLQLFLSALLFSSVTYWFDAVRQPLAVVGCLYLLWLAFKLAKAQAPGESDSSEPMSWHAAALFQNVNPKAWVMIANTCLLFMPREGGVLPAVKLLVISILLGIPCCSLWAWGGDRLRHWLQNDLALRLFNYSMAALLGGTALWLLLDEMVAH